MADALPPVLPKCACGGPIRVGDARCPACGAATPWADRVAWPDGKPPDAPTPAATVAQTASKVVDAALVAVLIGVAVGALLGYLGVFGGKPVPGGSPFEQPWFSGGLWGGAAGGMLGVQRAFRKLDR